MPLQRNEFLPQSLTSVYASPSGMADIRTGLPYQAGGLMVGAYFDLTEAEAQSLSGNVLHTGRYRFVQVDSTATAANVKFGSVGLLKSLALGVNFITSFDKGIAAGLHPVVFVASPSSTQISAGAYIFVQEAGIATVNYRATLTNGTPAVGDLVSTFSGGGGLLDDLTQSTQPTFTQIANIFAQAITLPTGGGQGVVELSPEIWQG
jgi:hypothetical protein